MQTKRLCSKSLVLGALAGVLSVLFGAGVAHANCDYAPGGLTQEQYQAYDVAFALAEESCDYMAHGWIEDGIPEDQVGGYHGMYEACMRLSVPPMVLPPAQHYDTEDGAFWRTVEGE